jgi:hypothetical protein
MSGLSFHFSLFENKSPFARSGTARFRLSSAHSTSHRTCVQNKQQYNNNTQNLNSLIKFKFLILLKNVPKLSFYSEKTEENILLSFDCCHDRAAEFETTITVKLSS